MKFTASLKMPFYAVILKMYLAATGHVYVMSFHPTQIWQEAGKPATDLASFTRTAKCIFFQLIIHITIFAAIIFGV